MARLLVASMWWTYPHLRALTGTPPTTHKSIIFCSYSSNSSIHELRDHSFLQLLAGWLAGWTSSWGMYSHTDSAGYPSARTRGAPPFMDELDFAGDWRPLLMFGKTEN